MIRTRIGLKVALSIALVCSGHPVLAAVAAEAGGAESSRSSAGADRRPGVARDGAERIAGQPVFAPEGFDSIVIFATNSVEIGRGAVIGGDVVVNDASAGPTLAGPEILINRDGAIDGAVTGDTVELKQGASVTGNVSYNELIQGSGVTVGGLITPLTLPVFDAVPTFNEAFPTTNDQVALAGETLTLAPGRYGALEIQRTATVVLSGGSYDFEAIVSSPAGPGGQCPYPCRLLLFGDRSEVRVAGRVALDRASYVGPQLEAPGTGGGCNVTPNGGAVDIVFFVGGTNGDPADPSSTPAAVKIDRDACVGANFYAPNGTIVVDQGTIAAGAFFARDVKFSARGELATAFGNHPPTADPQSVQTNGDAAITITLTGSDPEGLDLSFSIATLPTEGTLSNLTEIVPAPVPEIDRDTGLPTGNFIQPPVTSATVVYTPNTADDVEDSFVFTVTDPPGAVGMATVTINPFDGTGPGTPIDVIDARDSTLEAVAGEAQVVVLSADAPQGTVLELSIVGALPAGSLTDSLGNPIGSTPYLLPDNQVVYLAPATGPDSFSFEAADAAAVLASDTATVSFLIAEQTELAVDQSVTTNENTPVPITLGANEGGTSGAGGSSTIRLYGEVTTPNSAAVAGNVSDAENDGTGDGRDNLPGPAPVLVAAGVDVNLGGASAVEGVARIQIEWDISALQSSLGDSFIIDAARVILHTQKGTVDSVDTQFFAGTTDQDGVLAVSDFEAPVTTAIAGSTMPVPAGPTGTTGTFTFNVTSQLGSARCGFEILSCGTAFTHFSLQGRVVGEQSLVGQGFARGLQVLSTATGNALDERPVLEVDASETFLTWRIESLPANGTLTFGGQPVAVGDRFFSTPTLLYTPSTGFSETDTFTYSVRQGFVTDLALVTIFVLDDGCEDNGRDPGCAPGG
jgi:cytoskeletal protein CcmA (bactofilin family)